MKHMVAHADLNKEEDAVRAWEKGSISKQMERMENKYSEARQGAWFMYLLECSDGSIYTGIAVDVQARFLCHASGKGARYTRSRPPRRVLAVVAYPDRSTALRAEYAMKRMSALDKRRFCLQRKQLWCLPSEVARLS